MSATLATEDILIIETPERVPLHFALASIGNRFLACAIDHTIQWLALAVIAIASLILANFSSHRTTDVERAEVGLRAHGPLAVSNLLELLRLLRVDLERTNSGQAMVEVESYS